MTDDARALRQQLEGATGERISALEGIGEAARGAAAKGMETDARAGESPDRDVEAGAGMERDGGGQTPKEREPAAPTREKSTGMDFGL